MSIRGVWQLKKLTFSYCKVGGSSRGQRDFLESTRFKALKSEWPHVCFEVIKRGSKHPYVKGEYLCGRSKVICVRNKEQDEIAKISQSLHDSRGHKSKSLLERFRVVSKRPSLQGQWNPGMVGAK